MRGPAPYELTAEELLDQRLAREAVVCGNVSEDPGQRPDPQIIVIGNGDVMLLWLLAREADVAARLPAYPVAE